MVCLQLLNEFLPVADVIVDQVYTILLNVSNEPAVWICYVSFCVKLIFEMIQSLRTLISHSLVQLFKNSCHTSNCSKFTKRLYE